MKKVKEITETEKENLEEIKKYHPKYRERERARGIILSYRGYSPKEIAEIFEISDRMVYNWIDNFNENGIIGLLTKRSRKKANLKKKEHEEKVKSYVEEHPFQLSTVCAKLLNDGIEISKKSLKIFLKKMNYSYKRARTSITKQDKEIIKEAKKEIILKMK